MKHLSEQDLEVFRKYGVEFSIYNKLSKYKDVLQWTAEGYTTNEIAVMKFKSHRTVEHYFYLMKQIIPARSKAQLVQIAKDLKVI